MVARTTFDVQADKVAVICREIGVKRLELIGRAVEGIDFDPKVHGIDFLVEFLPGSERPWMREYSELLERLTELYGRCIGDVSLTTERVLQDPEYPGNPEYAEWINATRTPVYDAAL